MKNLTAFLSVALLTLSAPSFAATCDAQAAEKKLAGAAKNSFVQKCEKDAAAALATATATCEAQAADKKPKTASPRNASRTQQAADPGTAMRCVTVQVHG